MFEDLEETRPENWRTLRALKLRQMASQLRTHASRRPPQMANTLRQRAVELERSATSMDDVISRLA